MAEEGKSRLFSLRVSAMTHTLTLSLRLCRRYRYTVTQLKLAFFMQDHVLKKRRARKRSQSPKADMELPIFTVDLATAIPLSSTSTSSTAASSSSSTLALPAVVPTSPSPSDIPAASDSTFSTTPASGPQLCDWAEILEGEALGPSSIKQYVAAIVDLWRKQTHQGINNSPNPREGPVQVLLQTLRLQQSQHHRASYQDRGTGTLLDGISQKQQLVGLANDVPSRRSIFGGIRNR